MTERRSAGGAAALWVKQVALVLRQVRAGVTRPGQGRGEDLDQQVAIARAFVNRPALLPADEPTGNLDPENSSEMMKLLDRINRTGTTVLVATHDRTVVDQMRKRVIELDKRKLIRDELAAGYVA